MQTKRKILLVGETARGKDTVCRFLQNEYGLVPVCSYTDRPKREKEINGQEHMFLTKKEARHKLRKNADSVIAFTKIGKYQYFAFRENLEQADIYIIDPNGIRYLREHCPDMETVVIYVTCKDSVAKTHALSRGDSMEAFQKRVEDESEQFSEFRKNQDYDILLYNNGTKEQLLNNVKALMESERSKP